MKLSKIEAEKLRASIQGDLISLKPESFVMRRLFGRSPLLFDSLDQDLDWRVKLGAILGVDAYGIALIGSACTGVSLSPYKNFKAFDHDSDFDVAVVSGFHFDLAWRFLREIGAKQYALDRTAIASLKEHTENNVFWGMIATDKLLQHLPFGKDWIIPLAEFAKLAPVNGRELKVRVYRDSHSMVSYHMAGCRLLNRNLLSTQTGA